MTITRLGLLCGGVVNILVVALVTFLGLPACEKVRANDYNGWILQKQVRKARFNQLLVKHNFPPPIDCPTDERYYAAEQELIGELGPSLPFHSDAWQLRDLISLIAFINLAMGIFCFLWFLRLRTRFTMPAPQS